MFLTVLCYLCSIHLNIHCSKLGGRQRRGNNQSDGYIAHRAAKYSTYVNYGYLAYRLRLLLVTKVAGNLPSTQSLASSGVKPWLKTVGDDLSSELSRSPGRR
jgi:hypothetical protein